jgi:Zn-dependent membrane protease YugP
LAFDRIISQRCCSIIILKLTISAFDKNKHLKGAYEKYLKIKASKCDTHGEESN